ncbi:MAG: orotidine-5'-phosphate decarboxylase [Balneolales bacterium]
MKFDEKLQRSIQQAQSVLCIGIDPNTDLFPKEIARSSKNKADQVLEFCAGVIKASHEYACAYKINTAYFEALGKRGFDILGRTKELIPAEKVVIADAKRGDVGHTADQYKKAFFDAFDFDAITLSPLMGLDTLKPYMGLEEKAIFVLALTSNAGANDFFLKPFGRSNLSGYIAESLQKEQQVSQTSIGMVIGATQDAAGPVLGAYPGSNLLIPGIGAQGGSLEKLEQVLKDHNGFPLVSVSRGILYPESQQGLSWMQAIEKQARDYHQQLHTISQKYV